MSQEKAPSDPADQAPEEEFMAAFDDPRLMDEEEREEQRDEELPVQHRIVTPDETKDG